MSRDFDPRVVAERPAYEFFSEGIRDSLLSARDWPTPGVLSRWATQLHPLAQADAVPRFIDWEPHLVDAPLRYERVVASMQVPTRHENWHDLMNALVWMHLPRSKRVLNAIQLDETEPRDPRNGRSARQNAAALFDECGVVVWSDTPQLLDHIRELRWKELFWERRNDLERHLRLIVIGHGLLDILRAPYLGLVGKVLLQNCEPQLLQQPPAEFLRSVDGQLESRLWDALPSPSSVLPLPLLGMPGWHPEQRGEFYNNTSYFRPRRSRPAKTTPCSGCAPNSR